MQRLVRGDDEAGVWYQGEALTGWDGVSVPSASVNKFLNSGPLARTANGIIVSSSDDY